MTNKKILIDEQKIKFMNDLEMEVMSELVLYLVRASFCQKILSLKWKYELNNLR